MSRGVVAVVEEVVAVIVMVEQEKEEQVVTLVGEMVVMVTRAVLVLLSVLVSSELALKVLDGRDQGNRRNFIFITVVVYLKRGRREPMFSKKSSSIDSFIIKKALLTKGIKFLHQPTVSQITYPTKDPSMVR